MKKLLIVVIAAISALFLSLAHAKTSQKEWTSVDSEPTTKSVNLRVFIPQLFVGYFGGVWDIGLSPTLSLGPIVRVFVVGDDEGYDVGLNVNYSLSGNLFKSGFILNPYVGYYHGNYDQPVNVYGVRPKEGTVVVGIQLMYQWMFDNGFNIMAGLGGEYACEKIPVTMIGNDNFHAHYEVTLGYAF